MRAVFKLVLAYICTACTIDLHRMFSNFTQSCCAGGVCLWRTWFVDTRENAHPLPLFAVVGCRSDSNAVFVEVVFEACSGGEASCESNQCMERIPIRSGPSSEALI